MLYYFLQKYKLTKYDWKLFNFPSYFLQKIIIDIYILVIYKILTKKKTQNNYSIIIPKNYLLLTFFFLIMKQNVLMYKIK